ncbi:hypothetical protein R3P38DRAFT_1929669 [Favolaschia claudopus]|uniref:Uncharacterized protein n=1 Tax=Favolaschia claudopus TaxID=2862362 RepID=A0AAW0A149_9AGAR
MAHSLEFNAQHSSLAFSNVNITIHVPTPEPPTPLAPRVDSFRVHIGLSDDAVPQRADSPCMGIVLVVVVIAVFFIVVKPIPEVDRGVDVARETEGIKVVCCFIFLRSCALYCFPCPLCLLRRRCALYTKRFPSRDRVGLCN